MSLATPIQKHHAIAFFEHYAKTGTYIRKGWAEAKPVKSTTVSKLRNALQTAFQTAIERNYWGVCSVLENQNPFRGIKIKGSIHQRRRRLREGEKQKLWEHFDYLEGLNKYYVPLAMYLALDTEMRMQEILGLTWEDIDFYGRRITIRKHKTEKKLIARGEGAARRIVLPFNALSYLLELKETLGKKRHLPGHPDLKGKDSNHIFINRYGMPMTSNALSHTWAKLARKAGLKPSSEGELPTFHDLRRSANDSFIKAKLEEFERVIMKDGRYPKSDGPYVSDVAKEYFLNGTQDKLDRHVLKGMTLKEAVHKTREFLRIKNGLMSGDGS